MMAFIYTVGEKEELIIESFGKYVKTITAAGLKVKLPWPFQTIAKRVSTEIYQSRDDLRTKTKDDIFVTIPIKMHLQVFDSKKYHYNSNNPDEQVQSRITAAMKQLTSKMDFAELYQARELLSEQVREKVGKEIEDLYGVKIVDVIVDEPQAPAEIQTAYNNVKASEREATAKLNNAEAEKKSAILRAEGRKEELRLDGEGVAEQRSAIFKNYAEQFNKLNAQGLTEEMAQQTILLAMANDTLRDAAKNGNVIITTSNSSDILSQIQALGKTLAKPLAKPANDGGKQNNKGTPEVKPS